MLFNAYNETLSFLETFINILKHRISFCLPILGLLFEVNKMSLLFSKRNSPSFLSAVRRVRLPNAWGDHVGPSHSVTVVGSVPHTDIHLIYLLEKETVKDKIPEKPNQCAHQGATRWDGQAFRETMAQLCFGEGNIAETDSIARLCFACISCA